jgi:hypothetical protein
MRALAAEDRTGEEIWCQLFSEPGAVPTSRAFRARASNAATRGACAGRRSGRAAARTRSGDFSSPGMIRACAKPPGITAYGLDMRAQGVDVRPLRQMNGDAHFTESSSTTRSCPTPTASVPPEKVGGSR